MNEKDKKFQSQTSKSTANFCKQRRHAKKIMQRNLNKKFLEVQKPRGAGSLLLIVPMWQDTGKHIPT
jgi:hypothetical protein